MRSILPILTLVMGFGLAAFAQDNPGTQFATTGACGNCNSYNGNIAAATPTAISACSGIADDDVFYTFTAPGPTIPGDQVGIKALVSSAAFDVVIELLTNANASLSCVNAVVGAGDEEMVYYGLTAGQTYHIRIHSADGNSGTGAFTLCLEQLPELFLRPPFVGLGPSGDGYSINENVNREFFANPGPVEKTGWLFVCEDDGTSYYREVNGTSTLCNLNTVNGICYDKTYMVYVRVMIGGVWCGYGAGRQIIMEPLPRTNVLPVNCGQTYDIYTGIITAAFLSNTQIYEWEFTTDNGNTVFTAFSPVGNSAMVLENIPQMRYNKVYQVRIRANICGLWGDWSAPCIIITSSLPYTFLEPQYCNTVQFAGAVLLCEYVANATTYVWQLAPIECGDASFTPIGPAQVFFQSNEAMLLSQATLTPGACYRVGVKPFVEEQQGDYGPFCQIQIAGGIAPGGQQSFWENEEPLEETFEFRAGEAEKIQLYPNPNAGNFMLELPAPQLDDRILIDVFDANGRIVLSRQVGFSDGQLLMMNSGLNPGIYLLRVVIDNSPQTLRFIVE